MVTKEDILEALGFTYAFIVITLCMASMLAMIIDGYLGRVPIYGQFSLSAITLLTFSGSVLFLYGYYKHVWVLPRILCSLSLPVLGISFHEMTWHIGCYLTWGTGIPQFWGAYSLMMFSCILWLNKKYHIIKLSKIDIYTLVIFLMVYGVGWIFITEEGFYQKLLCYEKGMVPNPHNLFIFGIASLGRLAWLSLVSRPGGTKTV